MSKHTPGPWQAKKFNPRSRYPEILIEATDEDGELSTIGVAYHFDDCLEANARLIAQVPAMVAALREAASDIADLAQGQGLHAHEFTAKIDAILAAIDGGEDA